MEQTAIKEMINHQKLWLESGLSFEKWIENYLNKYLEMEKEQIIEARFTAPILHNSFKSDYIKEAEEYYNKTFKSE